MQINADSCPDSWRARDLMTHVKSRILRRNKSAAQLSKDEYLRAAEDVKLSFSLENKRSMPL